MTVPEQEILARTESRLSAELPVINNNPDQWCIQTPGVSPGTCQENFIPFKLQSLIVNEQDISSGVWFVGSCNSDHAQWCKWAKSMLEHPQWGKRLKKMHLSEAIRVAMTNHRTNKRLLLALAEIWNPYTNSSRLRDHFHCGRCIHARKITNRGGVCPLCCWRYERWRTLLPEATEGFQWCLHYKKCQETRINPLEAAVRSIVGWFQWVRLHGISSLFSFDLYHAFSPW